MQSKIIRRSFFAILVTVFMACTSVYAFAFESDYQMTQANQSTQFKLENDSTLKFETSDSAYSVAGYLHQAFLQKQSDEQFYYAEWKDPVAYENQNDLTFSLNLKNASEDPDVELNVNVYDEDDLDSYIAVANASGVHCKAKLLEASRYQVIIPAGACEPETNYYLVIQKDSSVDGAAFGYDIILKFTTADAVGFTGLANEAAEDGNIYYYTNGEIDKSHTGIDQNASGWWRVENGVLNKKANGIYSNPFGWWKTTNGKVTFDETGVFKNEYGWWRVEDSKVNFNAQGIYQNEYGWWKTTNGKVNFDETGVFPNEYGWWRVEDSKVNFKYHGIAKNDYGWWYLKDGKVQFGYTGLAQNSLGRWYIDQGKVDFNYDGKVTYKGITYTCTDGKVTGGSNSAETNAVKVLNSVGWDFKKAYYWTINNITYNKNIVPVDGSYGIQNYANHGFVQKSGNCYTFSCCVYYLGRMANEDIHIIKGTVPYASGGRGNHSWNEITRDGKKYVLDAQYEQKWRKQGRKPYSGWLFTYGTKGSLVYAIQYRMD